MRRTLAGTIARTVRRERYLYLIFFLPFVYYVIFKYSPMYGVIIAFKDYNVAKGIVGAPWVGLKHFEAFLSDPYAWKLIRNTILLNVYSIIFGFPAPAVLALLLNEIRARRFKSMAQTMSYLPHFISTVVVCGMIVSFLSTDGPLNAALRGLGGAEPVAFLLRPEWFRAIYVVSGIWQETGWNSIIYLAALTSIDPQLYEAAVMDGANRLRQMAHVTLPGLLPTITIMFLLTLGRIMVVGFEKILLLYTGSTYETADVLATYVYRRGLVSMDFSFATAVGLFESLVGLIFVVAANAVARRLSETSLW